MCELVYFLVLTINLFFVNISKLYTRVSNPISMVDGGIWSSSRSLSNIATAKKYGNSIKFIVKILLIQEMPC